MIKIEKIAYGTQTAFENRLNALCTQGWSFRQIIKTEDGWCTCVFEKHRKERVVAFILNFVKYIRPVCFGDIIRVEGIEGDMEVLPDTIKAILQSIPDKRDVAVVGRNPHYVHWFIE